MSDSVTVLVDSPAKTRDKLLVDAIKGTTATCFNTTNDEGNNTIISNSNSATVIETLPFMEKEEEPTPFLSSTPIISTPPTQQTNTADNDASLLLLTQTQEDDRTLVQMTPNEQKLERNITHLFQAFGQLTEEIKAISTNTAGIPAMHQSLQNFEGWVRGELATLSGRVLINEEEVGKLHAKTNGLSTKVNPILKQIQENDERMLSNTAEIMSLKEKLNEHLSECSGEDAAKSFYFDTNYVEETVTSAVNREFHQANANLHAMMEELASQSKREISELLAKEQSFHPQDDVFKEMVDKNMQELADKIAKDSAKTSTRILDLETLITQIQLKPTPPLKVPTDTSDRIVALESSIKGIQRNSPGKISSELLPRISNLENSMKKIQEQPHIGSAETLKRLQDLETSLKHIQQNQSHPSNDRSKEPITKNKKTVSFVGQQVTTNNIIVGDSNYNIKRIDPTRIYEGEEFETFTCYTIEQVNQFLDEVEVVVQPKKLLLGVGTNDIDEAGKDEIVPKYRDMINRLRSKFPNTRIYASLIFTRKKKEVRANAVSTDINTELFDICDEIPKISAFFNNNITDDMLEDTKHLDRTGRFALLSNMRFAMFGQLPSITKGRRKR